MFWKRFNLPSVFMTLKNVVRVTSTGGLWKNKKNRTNSAAKDPYRLKCSLHAQHEETELLFFFLFTLTSLQLLHVCLPIVSVYCFLLFFQQPRNQKGLLEVPSEQIEWMSC